MNVLILNAKRKWCGVITLCVKIAQELHRNNYKSYVISRKSKLFTKESLQSSEFTNMKFGMDFNPILILKLIFFIKKNKITLLITNMKKEILVGGIAAKLCGIKNIRIVGNERDFEPGFVSSFMYKHFVDHFIAPSKHTVQQVFKRCEWLDKDRVSTVYNGQKISNFDVEKISVQKREWGFSEDNIIIGTTGRLVKNKAVDQLVHAFERVHRNHPETRLVITGIGNELENLKDLAKEIELEDNIHFAGFTHSPLLAAAAYDIGVMASKYEGFPFVLLEYLSSNTVAVSSNFKGVHEVLTHAENGLIYRYGDIDDLAKKIITLIDNSNLKNELIRNGEKTIRENFTEEKMNKKFLEIIINHSRIRK